MNHTGGTMKALRLALVAALLALSSSNAGATAAVEPTNSYQGSGPKQRVVRQGQLVSATLASTRTLSIEQLQDRGGYGLLVLYVCIPVDADNSVTAPQDTNLGPNASLSPSAPAQIPFYVTGGGNP
jgi:hypothetical protein